jgi:hypothetical protein
MVTLEEASRCPKCNQPGVEVSRTRVVPKRGVFGQAETSGGQLVTFQCQTKLCRWFGDICRVVQIRPDGTVPEPDMRINKAKEYPKLNNPDAERMVRDAERLLEEQLRQGREM